MRGTAVARRTGRSTGPPRVLALSDHLGHSGGRVHGATTYYLTVFPELVRRGVDLTACFLGPAHPAAGALEAKGVRPLFLGRRRWDPMALAEVLRLIDERDVEVLHLSAFKSHILGRIAAALTGRPAIIHLHDTVPLARWNRFVQHRLARWTDLALAVSTPVAALGVDEYGLPAERVRVLHNAIDLAKPVPDRAESRARLLSEFGLPAESRLVGIIGRLAPMKGHEYLLRALPALLARCPAARILVCGDGPDRDRLQRCASEIGVAEATVFAGQRSDIPQVLAALDVVAMPSVSGEGLPYVAIEAIAAGRAIVAFPTAGIPEVVRHDDSGILVPKGDVDALAKTLADVLLDEGLRWRLETAALADSKRFGVDGHVDALLGIYADLRTIE